MEKFNIAVYFTDETCKEKFIKLCKINTPNPCLGCVDNEPLSFFINDNTFTFIEYPYSNKETVNEKYIEALLFVSSYDYFLEDYDVDEILMRFKNLNIEHFLYLNNFERFTSNKKELQELINQLEEQKINLKEILGISWDPYVKTLFMNDEIEGNLNWKTTINDFFLGVREYMHTGIPVYGGLYGRNTLSPTSFRITSRIKHGQLHKDDTLYLYYQGELVNFKIKMLLASTTMPTYKAKKGSEAKLVIETEKPIDINKDHLLISKNSLVKGTVLNIYIKIPTVEQWGENYYIKTEDILTFFIQDKEYVGEVSIGMGQNETSSYYKVLPGEERLITVVFKEEIEVVIGQSLEIGLYNTNPYIHGKIIAFGDIVEVFKEYKKLELDSHSPDIDFDFDF